LTGVVLWGALVALALGCAGRKAVAPPTAVDAWLDLPPAARCAQFFSESGVSPRRMHMGDTVVRFVDVPAEHPTGERPWLLVHGYGGTLCDFARLVKHLHGQRRVLALDLPGFGESASADERNSIDSHIAVLREFVARTDAGPVHLICHSLGGHVCLGAALTAPTYIASLTLIDTAGIYDAADFPGDIAKRKAGVNLGRMSIKRGRSLVEVAAGDQELLRRLVAHDSAVWTAVSSFRSNYRQEVAHVRTPTLVIWGMEDPLFPVEDALFLAENLPNARTHIVDGAGHCPAETHPEVVARLIEGFVTSLAAPNLSPDGGSSP
jgi:pyruvate dehydrogenase E2 component (dihydrolipoamide acetyltransferase)